MTDLSREVRRSTIGTPKPPFDVCGICGGRWETFHVVRFYTEDTPGAYTLRLCHERCLPEELRPLLRDEDPHRGWQSRCSCCGELFEPKPPRCPKCEERLNG